MSKHLKYLIILIIYFFYEYEIYDFLNFELSAKFNWYKSIFYAN